MKVDGAAEYVEGCKKSLELMIQRDFTQHFCIGWTLMVDLRCLRLFHDVTRFFQSAHSF